MDHRSTSILAFSATVAAAMLGAAVITGSAHAEGPIGDTSPFAGSRSRAEVRTELMQGRMQVTAHASEWTLQGNPQVHARSGYTRDQARAGYIASRDEVRAMNSESGGAGYFARSTVRTPTTLAARRIAQ